MYIDGRITDLYSEAGWKTIKSRFLTYFNPIESTKEQQIKVFSNICNISLTLIISIETCKEV